jgi:hypothetical protein
MKPSEIEATFPTKRRLPDPIVDICRFLEAHGYPISGCFELSKIGVNDVAAWFRNDEAARSAFMPFGRGACGDVYAIWLIDDLPPERAPIVILGSEGQVDVLASDSTEFCRLLCLGYSEVGLDDSESAPENYEETKPFRDFIQKKYDFDLPRTAHPIIENARSLFPCFQQWVEEHQK